MALAELRELTIAYRGPALLDDVSCQIEQGQRIGLLGRNGAGKTTLMRLLAGDVQPDHGEVVITAGSRVAILPQDVPQHLPGTIAEVVGAALHEHDPHLEEWDVGPRVDKLLSRMGLDGSLEAQSLSSGMKRRVLLAQTLVTEPDLLLLDEPTNHLDIDAITWLEELLLGWPTTLLFITHDRAFLRRLATRILEIDRGRIFDWSCDYDTFLVRKEQALDAEEKQNALFDKRLAEEEAWIRQGIKARRTRNEGRVRALEAMREERAQRRERVGKSKLEIQSSQKSGALVAKAEGISFAYGDQPIVADFSTDIMRGDKIGIIGPNGAGKTTLLKLLLGQLKPQQGSVRLGTKVEVAYFDQLRRTLDGDQTVQENVGEGSDSVTINGRSRHVLGYLQDFLFTPERARTEVRFLSGGEQNRILLAKLFAKPANVIVMDEPTNDLDAETLEMLEERLIEFDGTLLVVSHDRAFLNNVVTSVIAFEPGGAREYVGGYDDWVRQRKVETPAEKPKPAAKSNAAKSGESKPQTTKLSYKDQRELEMLPGLIEKLEAETLELTAAMSDPEFFKKSPDEISTASERMKQLNDELAHAYERWEELEG
ncbi:ATP-binding cassette domain-containing protein [Aeoliella sp.]|uniref:ATP-binding cassette domain-containing protein n=1 Tax=Aeoliella sp. TaxID=2795800 RepID=UPI003CCC4240